jgi:hypothetical protein
MTRVFVSSTVFDLIDIRAELEALLREMHCTPVLSDSNNSDFDVAPDKNSVECCLLNLRRSDIVLVVLCQRYGPLIPVIEDGRYSATHLEYLEARKARLPIYLYVRDRLEADLALRKRNNTESFTPAWAQGANAKRLLDLLDDHKRLADSPRQTNWASTFTDSLDLKRLVRRDLRGTASRADLEYRIQDNKVPWVKATLELVPDQSPSSAMVALRLRCSNHGVVAAFQCKWSLSGELHVDPMNVPVLAPGQETYQTLFVPRANADYRWNLTVIYHTSHGDRIEDRYSAGFLCRLVGSVLCGASFVGKTFFPSDGSVIPYTLADAPHTQAESK